MQNYRGTPNLQDRLEILQANLSTVGPIRPQGALYAGMLQDPNCEVSLSEVAAFLLANGIGIPPDMQAFTRTEPRAATEPETKEQREDRRLRMCEDAGLKMDKAALLRLPDGVGRVADLEGVTRQAFSDDVKAALQRKVRRAGIPQGEGRRGVQPAAQGGTRGAAGAGACARDEPASQRVLEPDGIGTGICWTARAECADCADCRG